MRWSHALAAPIIVCVAMAGCAKAAESQTSVTVKNIIAKHLDIATAKVTDDARLMQDLKADSLDFVELIMAVEEEFKISIPDDEAMQLVTVGDFVRYAEGHQK
jgi:acyl carrier protein